MSALFWLGCAAGVQAQTTQEPVAKVSEEHLRAAVETVFISRVTRGYVTLVPNITERVRVRLLEQKPELTAVINKAVDETALTLAERQGELDLLIANAWARRFSVSELRDISAFYATTTGAKFARVNAELNRASVEIV